MKKLSSWASHIAPILYPHKFGGRDGIKEIQEGRELLSETKKVLAYGASIML
jgi:hypothetical protein